MCYMYYLYSHSSKGKMVESNHGSSPFSLSLEDTIGRCVREEMQHFQGSRSGVQSLLDRARTLIRKLSFSLSSELRKNYLTTTVQTTTMEPSRSSNSTGLSAFVPRASPSSVSNLCLTAKKGISKKGATAKKGNCDAESSPCNQSKKKTAFKYEAEHVAKESMLLFCDIMVVLRGEIDLVSDHTEDQIRQ